MDDTRIAELTAEVLADLRAPAPPAVPAAGVVGSGGSSLEARVASLEAALHTLAPAAIAAVAVAAAAPASRPSHVSLQLLPVPGGGDRCVLEPDKPCVSSGMCRTFGH